MEDRPIFIFGCAKSGTKLMRNLFDWYAELFVVTFESHFFQNTGRGIDYYRRTIKLEGKYQKHTQAGLTELLTAGCLSLEEGITNDHKILSETEGDIR